MSNKYRKKPVVIDAKRFTHESIAGGNLFRFEDGSTAHDFVVYRNSDDKVCLQIKTLEGTLTASIGDWIIRGVNGEFYPCKPDIFDKTYEPA
jgi:hypothetical protein